MAKYIVTSGSNFTPYSYDELVKPLSNIQARHDAAQEVYDALELDTESLNRYISDAEDDAQTRAMYDNYRNKLNELQEDLYNNGYTPRTKRNLSAARAAYASDITRIAKAVETRQQRSQEYWKYKHEHPDMIMGTDPVLSGLDNYLNDDLYGQNYYQYSGNDFANQVAADAQARAKEVFSMPQYRNNPYVQGYIQKIKREGFSDNDISAAIDAVHTGDTSDLDVTSRILYDVLNSHLDSTGAFGNVSDEEYERLINYGRSGLSRAIGGVDVDDLQDRAFVAPSKTSGSGTGGDEAGGGYSINSPIISFQTPQYSELSKMWKKQNRKYDDGPKTIFKPDGTSENVDSFESMTNLVYNPEVRRETRQLFGGLDVALSAKDLEEQTKKKPATYSETEDQNLSIIAKRLDGDRVGIYYNNGSDWKLDDTLTEEFNKRRQQYQDHVKSYTDNEDNKRQIKNFGKYALTHEEEKEWRDKYNIDPSVDTQDVFYILAAKERVGDYHETTLADASYGMDAAMQTLATAMLRSYKIGQSNGKIGKDSKYALYPVAEGGLGKSDRKRDAITDWSDVFDKEDIDKNLLSISFTPDDIAAGAGTGRPMFRLTSKTAPGEYMADAEVLGDMVWNTLKEPIAYPPYYGKTMCDVVSDMMAPILRPEEVMSWSDDEKIDWLNETTAVLNGMNMERAEKTGYLSGPINTQGGTMSYIDPADIVRFEAHRNKLYNDISNYIKEFIANPRDRIQQDHTQYKGASSTKAEGLTE